MVLAHRMPWDARALSRHPLLWPLAGAAAALADCNDWPTRPALDAMYAAHTAHLAPPEPLRFVANLPRRGRARDRAEPVCVERLYDGSIALHREVPTRERDWHDLFNALCFATFPRAKLALHRRQYRVLRARVDPQARTLPAARTREQDTLTLFDEGGLVVAVDAHAQAQLRETLVAKLPARVAALERQGHARRLTFGHALYEHYIEDLVGTRGGARTVEVEAVDGDDAALLRAVDAALAAELSRPDRFCSPDEHLGLVLDGTAA